MGARELTGFDQVESVDALWERLFAPHVVASVDEWADRHRVLPAGSAEAGPWRTDRTPYARQIYRDLSDASPYEDVVLMCATQLVKSEAGLNWLGSIIDQTPGPVMVVQPTRGLAERYSKQRIAPMIRDCATLRGKVKDSRLRDSGNTVLLKEFPGGMLVLTGAESAAGLASMPARFIHFDERDDYPDDVEGQGEPTKVASARQDTYRRRKRLTSSSPKRAKGLSRIEQEFEAGTRFRYHVPCPHCEEKQVLKWANVRWSKEPIEDPLTACYVCEHCAAYIEEHHKTAMLAGGEWIAENPDARVRSYHLSSLYSPYGWLPWSALASQWIDAMEAAERGDQQPLKTFLNTRLAETWEEQAEQIASSDLRANAEPTPLGIVPMGGLVVVASVDVQDDRFEIAAWAFGALDQMWLFDYTVLKADPGLEEDWRRLDAVLCTKYPHEGGATLPIRAVAIDTGGHYTHEVYRYVRRVPGGRKVSAIKGADRPNIEIYNKPTKVDVNSSGGVIKGGVSLWQVGVNKAKDLIYARLKRPGQVHLSAELPEQVFDQLTAEHRVKHRTARGMRYVWKPRKAGARNEAWDLAVYAIWCAERLGILKWPKSVWDSERARVMGEKGSEPVTPRVQPLTTVGGEGEATPDVAARKPQPLVPVVEKTPSTVVVTQRPALFRPLQSTGGIDE